MTTPSPITLGINHVQVFVQGMSTVSRCDGVHPAEMTMLRGFYEGCQQDAQALTRFDDLVRNELSLEHARQVLDTPALRVEFLRSCVFLGYADGSYSKAERGKVLEFATALNIDTPTLAEIEAEVADVLMQQMAPLQNIDAVREVARETLKGD